MGRSRLNWQADSSSGYISSRNRTGWLVTAAGKGGELYFAALSNGTTWLHIFSVGYFLASYVGPLKSSAMSCLPFWLAAAWVTWMGLACMYYMPTSVDNVVMTYLHALSWSATIECRPYSLFNGTKNQQLCIAS